MNRFFLSGAFCLHNRVCIVEQTDASVLVGMVHPDNAELMDKISDACASVTDGSCSVLFMPVTEEECLRRITGTLADGAEVHEGSAVYGSGKKVSDAVDAESPAVNLLDNIVLEAAARNASDVHLEPYSAPSAEETLLCVRFRIAGTLHLYRTFDGTVFEQLVRRIKVLAGLNAAETRQCQDGRFIWQSAGDASSPLKIDVRVSCIPVWNGESVVLRLLKTLEKAPELSELGFSENQQKVLTRILSMKSRLVIVSGPTGAGKTTTLAAFLSSLSREGRKIVSVEDPVEYRIPGVTQIEVHEDLGLGFQDVLKRIFRHDPDILMIGEIRDELTACTAVRAALTGHLVFATLHASDACTAAIRLADLGIPPYLLSSVFGAVIAQELIPCNEQVTRRFAGRTLAAEILEGTPAVLELLSSPCTERELAACMTHSGMQRIREDAVSKKLLACSLPGEEEAARDVC